MASVAQRDRSKPYRGPGPPCLDCYFPARMHVSEFGDYWGALAHLATGARSCPKFRPHSQPAGWRTRVRRWRFKWPWTVIG